MYSHASQCSGYEVTGRLFPTVEIGAISNFFPRKDPDDRSRRDEASASCAHCAAACWGSEVLSAKEQQICYIHEPEALRD